MISTMKNLSVETRFKIVNLEDFALCSRSCIYPPRYNHFYDEMYFINESDKLQTAS